MHDSALVDLSVTCCNDDIKQIIIAMKESCTHLFALEIIFHLE